MEGALHAWFVELLTNSCASKCKIGSTLQMFVNATSFWWGSSLQKSNQDASDCYCTLHSISGLNTRGFFLWTTICHSNAKNPSTHLKIITDPDQMREHVEHCNKHAEGKPHLIPFLPGVTFLFQGGNYIDNHAHFTCKY